MFFSILLFKNGQLIIKLNWTTADKKFMYSIKKKYKDYLCLYSGVADLAEESAVSPRPVWATHGLSGKSEL